jgi:hypothetical protein
LDDGGFVGGADGVFRRVEEERHGEIVTKLVALCKVRLLVVLYKSVWVSKQLVCYWPRPGR